MTSKTLAFLLAALATPTALLAANSSVIRSPLTRTGVDTNASGSILSILKTKESLFSVSLANLNARSAYSLKIGLTTESEFTTDKKGRALLRFTTKSKKNKALLDFDPRGKTVEVIDGQGEAVLQVVFSGEGEPTGIVVDERADLASEDGVKGKGAARYVSRKDGRRSFEVAFSGVGESGLHVFVDGVDRGEIPVKGRSGRIAFSSNRRGNEVVLDFDPRSAKIEIKGSGVDDPVKFSGTLKAKAKGVNFATRTSKRAFLPATSAGAGGQAEVKLRLNADASKDFSVELEGVPAGSYELLVNNTVRGTIVVTERAEGGTQGEIEFTSNEDGDDSELPLIFDPIGTTLTIRQGTTIFFTGLFQPGNTPSPAPAPGTNILISEALASTRLDPNASGEAEFSAEANGEKEFEVEIEDVDAGRYQLFVGGVLRGTIVATTANNGNVKGKIKFKAGGTVGDDRVLRVPMRHGQDDPAGDDRGSGGGGQDDPAGDDRGSGGGGQDDPAGDDHGSGGGGQDDPAGDDNGGGGNGGRDDDQNVPRLPLRFDPRGQLIEVKNAQGVYFSHLFGDGSASIPGSNEPGVFVPGEISIALISSKADPDATAEAEFKRNERGAESFEVELEDLPVGSYELLVDGVVRGSINVVTRDRGTRGNIEFDDEPDGSEQRFTFDPLGRVIIVQKDGTVYFQRTFPSGS